MEDQRSLPRSQSVASFPVDRPQLEGYAVVVEHVRKWARRLRGSVGLALVIGTVASSALVVVSGGASSLPDCGVVCAADAPRPAAAPA